MKTYTVVGFHDDTGQKVVMHLKAVDWLHAFGKACGRGNYHDLVIVEVFEGALTGLTESSQIEYQSDYERDNQCKP